MAEQRAKILIVDDEQLNRDLLEDYLAILGYQGESVPGGEDALSALQANDYDVVLLDVMMTGMDGIETARRIRQYYPPTDLPIIMVTALSGRTDRLRAVEAGANDFIVKPVDRVELNIRIASQLKIKRMQDEIRSHQEYLESLVQDRTKDLQLALEEMKQARLKTHRAHLDTINRLGIAAEYKDKDTADHIFRVSHYCKIVAEGMGLPEGEVHVIYRASPMHDVGKLGIPDSILMKPGKLDEAEWKIMQQHTVIGAKILGESDSELLTSGAIIAHSHHEKWDGSGYPHGRQCEDIPISGRICAIADVFDALTSVRPYKVAYDADYSFRTIMEGKGTNFDPRVVDAFVKNFEKILGILHNHRE